MTTKDAPLEIANQVLNALRRLRDRHPDMTILQAMCFLRIAASPGISQRQLYEDLDASDSAASRILAILSDIGDRKTSGLDLISMRVNPTDRRSRILEITPKGRRLLEDIAGDLKKVSEETAPL